MQPLPNDDFYAEDGGWPSSLDGRAARLVLAAVLDLTDDNRTRHEPVRVSAQHDVVILTGTVASWAARDAAGTVVRSTPGARDLCNALRVADDARDVADVDQFDSLVAPMASLSQSEVVVLPPPPRNPPSRMAILVTVSAWCSLPVAVFTAHLPVVPVVLVVLAVTMAAVSLRLLSDRR